MCPNILFAAEHKDYFTHLNNQSTSLGNISYRASIYGTKFNKECFTYNIELINSVSPNAYSIIECKDKIDIKILKKLYICLLFTSGRISVGFAV